jgi:hypothetical protein
MSFQKHRWVVGFGCYCIVGDSLIHNFQNIILTLGTIGYVVKIVKDKYEVSNILLPCSDALASFVVIELSYSFSSDDLTPLPSLIKSPIVIFQSNAS